MVLTVATLPLNLGLTAINFGFTAINLGCTAINSTIVVINLTATAISGVWTLTKITYYGTKKVVEITSLPFTAVASFFAKRNHVIAQEQVRVEADDGGSNFFDEWLADAVIIADSRQETEVENTKEDILKVIQRDPKLFLNVQAVLNKVRQGEE